MKAKTDQALLRRFGAKLRQLRTDRGLTQAQLAKKVKVGSRTIFVYEQGRMAPSIDVIARLARFLEVTTDELIFNDEAQLNAVHDRELVDCLAQADQLPRRARAVIKDLVELLLAKHLETVTAGENAAA